MLVTAAKDVLAISRKGAESRPSIDDIVSSREREICLGAEREVVEMSGAKFRERGGGDHGCVIGGKRRRRKIDWTRETGLVGGRSQTGVGSHAAGDDERTRSDFFDGHDGTTEQF